MNSKGAFQASKQLNVMSHSPGRLKATPCVLAALRKRCSSKTHSPAQESGSMCFCCFFVVFSPWIPMAF